MNIYRPAEPKAMGTGSKHLASGSLAVRMSGATPISTPWYLDPCILAMGQAIYWMLILSTHNLLENLTYKLLPPSWYRNWVFDRHFHCVQDWLALSHIHHFHLALVYCCACPAWWFNGSDNPQVTMGSSGCLVTWPAGKHWVSVKAQYSWLGSIHQKESSYMQRIAGICSKILSNCTDIHL